MILKEYSIDFQWPTREPFLFCVHHLDRYPRGEVNFGPEKKHLIGRQLGQDFIEKDGFRMYHGDAVPGFPVHPHRGFETITVVRRGYVDHADSLGAAGRYGEGDVQWMTAGAGVQHSEMFPLLRQDQDNTLELFQIWLNLPRKSKMVSPHFKMFWNEKISRVTIDQARVQVEVIAGNFAQTQAQRPPPDSWASDPENEVRVLIINVKPGGKFVLPKAQGKTSRMLYYYDGSEAVLQGSSISVHTAFELSSEEDLVLSIETAAKPAAFLLLESKPIGEPTVQYGPFVMNSKQEIAQTIEDFRRTEFGGWSWPTDDPVHGAGLKRFAKYPDGKIETPT
jgi:redox-sensitive bicupin YhaK (pirin superfamily)